MLGKPAMRCYAVGLLSLALLGNAGCSGGGTPGGAATEKKGRLVIVSNAAWTDAEVAQLPGDFAEKAATAGWIRVPGGFERSGAAVETKLTDGRVTATTDNEGNFSFPADADLSRLQIVIDDKVVDTAQASQTRSQGSGVATWVLEIPYSCCAQAPCCEGESHDDGHEHKSRQQPMAGSCLDYNGWFSDGSNPAHTSVKGFQNFVMSDCDRAFFAGRCWEDFYPGKSCATRLGAGLCSGKIGHSASYHKHNFPK